MFVFRSLLILFVLQYTKCERRIINGERIDKPYVCSGNLLYTFTDMTNGPEECIFSFEVYLVWDLSNETLNEQYDTRTICGGVLILPNAVLSSAACLKMFEIQYAIAGYNRYVPGGEGRNKYETECLELAKKPIIEKCIPSQFDLYRPWIHFDIAVARLETSYDLNDQSFATKCSYQPKTAALKFEMLENIVNRDVLVFGWGSDHYHPPTDYTNDLSQDFLRATSTKIIDISQCAFAYGNLKLFRYCTEGQGFVDIHGKPKVFRRDRTNNASNSIPASPVFSSHFTASPQHDITAKLPKMDVELLKMSLAEMNTSFHNKLPVETINKPKTTTKAKRIIKK